MFLEINQLSVHYPGGRGAAVDAVSLGLGAGEIGVLIGPSGCGKTSLLRAIAGLEPAAAGQIRLAGELVSDAGLHVAPQDRRIGMVFQDYALFPHLDVAANVAFGLQALPKARRQERVARMLELVGLAQSAAQYPHQLSGGQQQRVALARALRTILKAAGATALFVTHDQLEAFAIGDVIGVMHQGQLHQWDDAYSLYHRPATRFVADFIGHGVFTPATLHEEGGQIVVDTPVGRLSDVAECPLPGAFEGGQCDVLLRADDIVHDDDAPVKAEIVRKAFRGSEFLYTLRLASGHPLMAHVPSHHDHKLGEWIGIRAQVDHVVTFNRVCQPQERELCQLPCAQAGVCAAEAGGFSPKRAAR
jgi:iron(III) transport system ATP-binding protein